MYYQNSKKHEPKLCIEQCILNVCEQEVEISSMHVGKVSCCINESFKTVQYIRFLVWKSHGIVSLSMNTEFLGRSLLTVRLPHLLQRMSIVSQTVLATWLLQWGRDVTY